MDILPRIIASMRRGTSPIIRGVRPLKKRHLSVLLTASLLLSSGAYAECIEDKNPSFNSDLAYFGCVDRVFSKEGYGDDKVSWEGVSKAGGLIYATLEQQNRYRLGDSHKDGLKTKISLKLIGLIEAMSVNSGLRESTLPIIAYAVKFTEMNHRLRHSSSQLTYSILHELKSDYFPLVSTKGLIDNTFKSINANYRYPQLSKPQLLEFAESVRDIRKPVKRAAIKALDLTFSLI